ncbi:hypothetical protein BJ944DRAFT_267148 [Cunninghamella echinulata]|nr:hypothetical protein BJ944DRAFT_267148 [Cunninghamella echinulata]
MERKQDGIIHVCILILLQWISITVVILNQLVLKSPHSKESLISDQVGIQDILLLVLGISSFLASSLPLCLHLYMYYRSPGLRSFAPKKIVLVTEMSISVIMIALWSATSAIVFTHFHVLSPCRFNLVEEQNACRLLNMAIITGMVAIGGWVILLIASSVSMTRLPKMPSFILEPNPYHTIDYHVDQRRQQHQYQYQNEHQNQQQRDQEKETEKEHEQMMMAAPPYTPSPQVPPPVLSSSIRSSYLSDDKNFLELDYPEDVKYPVYTIDTLPTIQKGLSKFNLAF